MKVFLQLEPLETRNLASASTPAALAQVGGGIGASQEYSAHPLTVLQLYPALLGRAADQAGLNYWTAQLAAGVLTPAAVVGGFTGSNEYVTLHPTLEEAIPVLYPALLNRQADDAGLAFWERMAGLNGDLPVKVGQSPTAPTVGNLDVLSFTTNGIPVVGIKAQSPASTPGAVWQLTYKASDGAVLATWTADDPTYQQDVSLFNASGLGSSLTAVRLS